MKERKLNRKVKSILVVCVMLLLFLPMTQQLTKLFEEKPLNGSFTISEDPQFSFSTWFDGTYQTEKQNYLNESFGFRSFFVRTYNQMQYSLYDQVRANGVILGKSGYLYEENYIKAHLGRDFIGEDKIAEKIEKLKRIEDTLKSKGIKLVIVFAPGKGSCYPEFIPERYNPGYRTTTNYEVYKKQILQKEFCFLDFNAWFRKMKPTSPHPLFPKTGIHWSKYGELLAADSIIKYINTIQRNKKIPELLIGEIEVSNTMRDSDDDIEKGMNLLFNIEDLPMGYPQFEVPMKKNNAKVLTVADSYYWGMFNWGMSRDAFNEGQFWFYNVQIYPDSYEAPLNVSDINIIEEVEKNDVVILMSTDANLFKFAFGFIDQLYEAYFGPKPNSESPKK